MSVKSPLIPTSPKVIMVTILTSCIGAIAGCRNSIASNTLPLAIAQTQPQATVKALSLQATRPLNSLDLSSEPVADHPTKNNPDQLQAALPDYCSPDQYETFFEHFVRGQDYQGIETRFTYTADKIEVRDFDTHCPVGQ